MAYIGSTPTSQGFVPAIDYFNGNGSTVLFTLSRNVTTSAQVEVIVDNVIQNPSSAFTVLNNTITFTSAPLAGSNNIWVKYVTLNTSTMVPGAGTVGTTQLGSIDAINSASTMSLKTGGITGLIINGSQNVGIGTSSPYTRLDVRGTSNTISSTIQIIGSGVSGLILGQNADGGVIRGQGGNNVLSFWTGGLGDLAAAGSGTERMRIDSAGNLILGSTNYPNPGGPLALGNIVNPNNDGKWALALQNNATTVGSGRGIGIRNATDFNNTTSEFIYCIGNTNPRFYVVSNGGIGNYSANNINISDERTKKNITNAGNYLDKICAIPVRTFLYKDQTDTDLNLGVIAQEVEAIAPELVNVDGFGKTPADGIPLKSIYQTDLQYALMKCIQEQQTLITALTARITALEAK